MFIDLIVTEMMFFFFRYGRRKSQKRPVEIKRLKETKLMTLKFMEIFYLFVMSGED